MPRNNLTIEIFVASPSDVTEERAALEGIVLELNKVWSRSLGLTFNLVKWESNVRPAFSSDPQSVVNEQIGTDYDVFIGIFWGRVGTPTPRAKSGTLEEFERAYSKLKKTNQTPEIMLYFKDAPIAPSKIDMTQLQQVMDFKKALPEKGGLYSSFEDLAGFESSLRAHLSSIAQKFSKPVTPDRDSGVGEVLAGQGQAISESDEDMGFLDYLEIFETGINEMTSSMERINAATSDIGDRLDQRTAEIDGRTQDFTSARRILRRAADDMSGYSQSLQAQLPIFARSRGLAFDALVNALALRGSVSSHDAELIGLRSALRSVFGNISSARTKIFGLRSSADALPRMTKELIRAKRSVVMILDKLLAEIESTQSTIANVVDSIDRMLRN